MSERAMSEIIADVRDYIRRQVVAGFDPSSSITESAVEVFGDDADEGVLRPVAERLTREIVASHLRDQEGWPEVTDCDRLDDAFAELNRRGIVCRQNFSCCGNCGVVEIRGEIEGERKAGLDVCGYAFYHMQDTESAAEGHGFYLNYGSVEDDEAAVVRVGQTVVETLQRYGLATRWNGRIDTRIHVQIDWKRHRPLEVDAEPS